MVHAASAAFLRQTILLSAYEAPEMRSLYNTTLRNVAGKMRTERRWSAVDIPDGIEQVSAQEEPICKADIRAEIRSV